MSRLSEDPQNAQDMPSEDSNTASGSASSQGAAGASENNDKYMAIRQAMREREEADAKAREQAEIADRIRRMKSAKEHPEEAPYKRREIPRPQEEQSSVRQEPTRGTNPKKRKKSASRKQPRRKGGLLPKQGDSPYEVIRKTIFLLSTTVFLVCLILIGKYFWENYQNSQKNEEIRRLVYIPEEEPEMEHDDSFKYYTLLPEAKILLEKNPETVGWIRIPTYDENSKSPVDYPVLQHRHPNELEGPDDDPNDGNSYYLDKDFYRNYERAGSIFMDYRNFFDRIDGSGMREFINSQNLVIYGHDMRDNSMFGSLSYYINDETYYDNHPIILLNSNYVRYKYKIFGMIVVDIDDDTETAFDYWNTLNFDDEKQFYDYVNEVKRRTVRNTEVDVKYGDQLLTLSTCNSIFSQGRLVIFARLLRDGESLEEGCTSTANPNIKWPNSYYKWHENTYDPNAEFVPYG